MRVGGERRNTSKIEKISVPADRPVQATVPASKCVTEQDIPRCGQGNFSTPRRRSRARPWRAARLRPVRRQLQWLPQGGERGGGRGREWGAIAATGAPCQREAAENWGEDASCSPTTPRPAGGTRVRTR